MTRVLMDGGGRRWIYSQGGIRATDEARAFRPGVDEIALAGLPILHRKWGDLRRALPVAKTWRDLSDEDLQGRLEDKLRDVPPYEGEAASRFPARRRTKRVDATA